jgi:hypothetical protein
MACDDVEALQPKKDLVFDLTPVEVQYQNREECSVWAVTGEQILEKHHPREEEIDHAEERFRVSYKGFAMTVNGKESKDFIWEFIPMKQPKNFLDKAFNPDCKVLIFKWPEEGYDYSIGGDCAGGGSGDNTVVSVNRKSKTGLDPDVQVAEFASNQVAAAEAHAYIMAMCALYQAEMAPGLEPMVAIEQVRKPGDTAQLQMKLMGYKRMYKFSRLDGRNPKRDQKKSKKEGWYTFQWSRDFLLDNYKLAVENGWCILNSPYLLRNEIPSFQIDQTAAGKTRYDHAQGKHDDRIFASAISYIIANDTESHTRRIENRFMEQPDKLPELLPDWVDSRAIPYEAISEGFAEL